MRLVMFESGRGLAAGVQLAGGDVAPLRAVLGDSAPATVAGLIAEGPDALQATAAGLGRVREGDLVPADRVRLGAPIGRHELIVCGGANYRSHNQEMGEGAEPERLAWFVKNSHSVIGPGEPIRIPDSHPETIDYEGEICVVIGRACHAVPAASAWDYVAGYTLLNDVSARDALPDVVRAQNAAEGRWSWNEMILGKQFPTFGPIGPAVVTTDEIADPDALRLTTIVNGVTEQDALVADLVTGIPEMIEEFSHYIPFQPGDVISTGTPSGVGAGKRPPVFLHSGDVVTVAVAGIGELTNPIA